MSEYVGLKYWLCGCYDNKPGILEDWGDLYQIDRDGAVVDNEGKRIIPYKGKYKYENYYYVDLVRDGKKHKRLLHRCVATTFKECGDYGEKYMVDHINSNPTDNRAENLRWVKNQRENMLNPATQKKIKEGRARERERIKRMYLRP